MESETNENFKCVSVNIIDDNDDDGAVMLV